MSSGAVIQSRRQEGVIRGHDACTFLLMPYLFFLPLHLLYVNFFTLLPTDHAKGQKY